MGEDAGWDYVRKLDAQVHRYNTSGTAAVAQVGLGEVGVGIAFAHDILKKGVEKGYPVKVGEPVEGTAAEVGAAAVIRGGAQREQAQQFITWLLSKRAQDLMAEFYRVPLNPAAKVADAAIVARDVKVVDFDAATAAARQPEILARWRKTTGR
jgi:iron(III) transport system substrate-binding protein